MNLELDHVFILVEPEARVADLLLEQGFQEGTGNQHPGQGTSNRRFYFANGMLEFIWVRDAKEAINGAGRDLCFPNRASNPTASPFGVILRRKEDLNSETFKMPFDGWTYQPIYFDPPNAFHVGANSQNISEPLCIYVPFSLPKSLISKQVTNKSFSIANVCIHTPSVDTKGILNVVNRADRLAVKQDTKHLMEIVLNEGKKGCIRDFRSELPLIIYW